MRSSAGARGNSPTEDEASSLDPGSDRAEAFNGAWDPKAIAIVARTIACQSERERVIESETFRVRRSSRRFPRVDSKPNCNLSRWLPAIAPADPHCKTFGSWRTKQTNRRLFDISTAARGN